MIRFDNVALALYENWPKGWTHFSIAKACLIDRHYQLTLCLQFAAYIGEAEKREERGSLDTDSKFTQHLNINIKI
jgi:hypothetical protein